MSARRAVLGQAAVSSDPGDQLMNMPVRKSEAIEAMVAASPAAPAESLRLKVAKPSYWQARVLPALGALTARALPPLVMLALILGVWQVLCMKPGATLPAPSKIWAEAYDLIVDPFFVAGPQDIGLGWRVLTSLQRVAVGYGLGGAIGVCPGAVNRGVGLGQGGRPPRFLVARPVFPPPRLSASVPS